MAAPQTPRHRELAMTSASDDAASNRQSLPSPLVPHDCDLTDFVFMPLDVCRLRDSDIAALATAEGFRAAVLAWCASWHQIPAGSLPDDDRLLARLVGFGRDVAGWQAIRDEALHGFTKCSDGRLYHTVVCEKALEASRKKQSYRARSKTAASKRWGSVDASSTPQASVSNASSNATGMAQASLAGASGIGSSMAQASKNDASSTPQASVSNASSNATGMTQAMLGDAKGQGQGQGQEQGELYSPRREGAYQGNYRVGEPMSGETEDDYPFDAITGEVE